MMLTYAASLGMVGRVDDAAVWVDRAQLRLAEGPDRSSDEAVTADALQLLMFTLTGVGPGFTATQGTGHVEGDRRPTSLLIGRSRCSIARALLIMNQPVAARQVLDAGSVADEIGQLLVRPAVAARIALGHGELRLAEELSFRAITTSKALGVDGHVGVLDARLALLGTFVERGELDEGRASLKEFMVVVDRYPWAPVYRILGQLEEARLAALLAGPDGGLSAIDRVRRALRRRSPLEALIDSTEARWRMEAGYLRRAEELLSRLPSDGCGHQLLAARLDLYGGRPEDASAHLETLGCGSLRWNVVRELLFTRLAMVLNDPVALDEHMSRAVELAAPEGLALPILEEGEALVRLARTRAEGLDTPEGNRLAAVMGAPSSKKLPHELTLLSDRESAILRFLPTRLTNQEIARECFMSVNTVKTHLKSMYSKLGVSSRSGAVQKARLQGLL